MISGEISMVDDNKKLPKGWGDNNDDDDYDLIDDTDEDDEDSTWGNNSPFNKSEPANFSDVDKDSGRQTRQIHFADKSKVKSKQSVSVQKSISPEFTPPPAPDIILPSNPEYATQKHKTNPVLIILIIILVLIIGMLGGTFFIMSRNKKSDEFNKNAGVSDFKKITDNENYNKETENVILEFTPETNISCNKDNVNQIYASIVKNMDFSMPNKGFILDLNNDGINEMIIPDTADMNFVMYYFDGNSIQSCSFGNFMALDNFVIYKVDGEEDKNYIYYRDNYSYKSSQGYYSFPSADELSIFIDYPENNGKYSADWTIDYNKTENYAKGNESTDTFYGQVPDCHDKLLSAFKNYGFEIDENSKYTKINGLYYDELIKALTPDSKSDSESKSSAKADVQVRNDEFHMANFYLCVSGDYSYYEYEMYVNGTVSKTGKTSDSEVWLGRASGEFELKIYVTPYNLNGVAGETVIYPNENTTPDSESDNKSRSSTNAYIELRDKIIKDTSSGFTKWHRASGADFYLHVNGDYSYYDYEFYMTDPYGSNSKLTKTDTTSNSEVYLTSGSGGFGIKVYITPYNSNDIAGETVICTLDENIERTFEPFTIKIENSYLGYYSGPGHDYEINGHITDHGTYTIIDESNGWGKLKSGKGWIYLDDASNESPLSHKTGAMLQEQKKVEVYSCNSLGTINTCGSTYINGYATSYIVDGGSSSCVRTDLRNGWHVTAVRYCFAYDTTWYELYDSDDGDYYGWVNSFNINFTPSYQGGLTDDGRGSEDEDIPEVPMTSPPVTEPPETSPPVTEPLITEPPATDPPVTEPPPTTDSWYDYDYSDDYG